VLIPNSICSTNFLKELCIFNTKSLKKFQLRVGLYQDEESMFDEMLDRKLELSRNIFWKYEWWSFKTRWKIKEMVGWLIFCDCNYVEKQLCGLKFVLFKHRWCWKIIGGTK
jgi:hypothetical protein